MKFKRYIDDEHNEDELLKKRLVKFQEDYEEFWKRAYIASLIENKTTMSESKLTKAEDACRHYYEAFGKPNRLYYSVEQYYEIYGD